MTPTRGQRAGVAVLFGIIAGLVSARAQFFAHGNGGDHLALWHAAHAVLAGGDPYAPPPVKAMQFYYPLPAVLLALPFAWASVQWASVLFVVCSASLLGYAITQTGFERVPLLLSVPFFVAAQFGQSSLAITALGLIAPIAGFTVLKPNLGLALFAWRPSLRFTIVAAAVILASVALSPSWPLHWFAVVRRSPTHHSPVMVGAGVLVLLALIRWRRPEARLLVAMSLIPHGLYFYDELPIWLVARTRREALFLVLTSWIGWFGWIAASPTGNPAIADMAPWVIWTIYLPALALVLRRPNSTTGIAAQQPPPASVR